MAAAFVVRRHHDGGPAPQYEILERAKGWGAAYGKLGCRMATTRRPTATAIWAGRLVVCAQLVQLAAPLPRPAPRALQEAYPALDAFTCPPQGSLGPGQLPLLLQPDHDAVAQCAARCAAETGCVSFDAGTIDGSMRCYRSQAGGGVSSAGVGYQYFSLLPLNDTGCVPEPRGCARDAVSSLGAVSPPRRGCTQPGSFGFDPVYNVDDGSCEPVVAGCIDPRATNRNAAANTRNDSGCQFPALDAFTCPLADSYLVGSNIIRTDVPGEMNHWTGLTVEQCA